MCRVELNNQLNGVEMYFNGKPNKTVLDDIKSVGFRWNGKKICWYAKQSEKTLSKAEEYKNIHTEVEALAEVKKAVKTSNIDLWNLTRVDGIESKPKMNTKDIAKEVRKELKSRFSFVKFSVTSDYNHIHCEIKSSPFEKDSEYLKAICEYANKLIESYNYCTCYDPYGDYGSSYHFYFFHTSISYEYLQTEMTSELQQAIKNYDESKIEDERLQREKEQADFEEYKKQEEIKKAEYIKREEQRKADQEEINNNVKVVDVAEDDQYFIKNCYMANCNKNNTYTEYQEEIDNNEYYLQDLKVAKEVYFNNAESLEKFKNMFLTDFDFMAGVGGTDTDDIRITSMIDYTNMSKEERQTVKFYMEGIAVYLNDTLQFVIDPEGYSHARYVGIIGEDTTKEKTIEYKQVLTDEEIKEYQTESEKIINIINDNFTDIKEIQNVESWKNNKKLIKEKLIDNDIILNSRYIQFISEEKEDIKQLMYRVFKECDDIIDQFRDADIQQGEELTIIKTSMIGGASASHIVLDSWKVQEYAQYKDNINIICKIPSKRGMYEMNLHDKDTLVYKGLLNIPNSVLYNISTSEAGFKSQATKYGSYDKQALDAIIEYFKGLGIKPIINTYKPVF